MPQARNDDWTASRILVALFVILFGLATIVFIVASPGQMPRN